jgi:hypothetical protein
LETKPLQHLLHHSYLMAVRMKGFIQAAGGELDGFSGVF